MSGEVNMIQTLRKFRGGPDQANLGGASLETFSGEAQLKKSPCIFAICFYTNQYFRDKPVKLIASPEKLFEHAVLLE